jgi:hypothetical protein
MHYLDIIFFYAPTKTQYSIKKSNNKENPHLIEKFSFISLHYEKKFHFSLAEKFFSVKK